MKGIERRHCPRVRARFWLHVEGVDAQPVHRTGDLSVTGVFVESDSAPGILGDTMALHLATEDQRCSTRVVGRVVRLLQSQDIWRGDVVSGVAYQFMPATAVERNAIEHLVLHAARTQVQDRQDVEVEHRFDAMVDSGAEHSGQATVHRVNLGGMSLETTWRVDPGQVVRVEIPTPDGGSVQFAGKAAQVRENQWEKYEVDVEFEAADEGLELQPGLGESMEAAVTTFIERMIVPTAPPPKSPGDLAGNLSAIRPPTLLSIIELAQMTGVLHLRRNSETGDVYFRDGQAVDVEINADRQESVREALVILCCWEHGTFEFRCQPVERECRLDMRTSAVLIDLARIQDELAAR